MKRIFFFLLVLVASLPVGSMAQEGSPEKTSWRKAGSHWARKNSITLSASVLNYSDYNAQGLFPLQLEYDRILPYNLSISAMGLYAPLPGRRATDTFTIRETFWFAGIKANYNLPVVRNWLYFRIGVGVGIGYHMGSDHFDGGIWAVKPEPPVTYWTKAHLIVDAHWVLRVTRWLELRFAPAIFSPSQFIVGSKLASTTFHYYDLAGTLGASVRF